MNTRMMIMAGGTGGHVFPALVVADELRRMDCEVVWMGTRDGFEAVAVPAAGFPVEWIQVTGIRGKGVLKWLLAPVQIARAVAQALAVLKRNRPNLLLGMGGFASGPGAVAGRLLRLPLVIHEQNAVAGLTNRILARFASVVLCAYPGVFDPGSGVEVVGNPVRPEIAALPAPAIRLARADSERRILVVGGSQGAEIFNTTMADVAATMGTVQGLRIWHQAGRGRDQAVVQRYRERGCDARVSEFIDDMAAAYEWADVVVCRAGALTVAEVAAAGCAALFVPYPSAVGDHQTRNAAMLADADAALLVSQDQFDPSRTGAILAALLVDRHRLVAMAERARTFGNAGAAARVARICMEQANA